MSKETEQIQRKRVLQEAYQGLLDAMDLVEQSDEEKIIGAAVQTLVYEARKLGYDFPDAWKKT